MPRIAVTTTATFSLAALLLLAACTDPTAPDASAGNVASGGATADGTSAQVVSIALSAPGSGAAYRSASGKAKLDVRNGRREFEAEVEHIPANVAVHFYLDDVQIGVRTTDQFGHAELELSSERGAAVPTSVAGRTVTVRTSAGAMIVTGTFQGAAGR